MRVGAGRGLPRRSDFEQADPSKPVSRSWAPGPWIREQGYGSRDFPFWKLALAIATGILLASALIWTAMELRARHELQELNRQLQAQAQKQRAEMQRIAQQSQERRREAERRAAAPAQRPRAEAVPFMRQGTNAMPVGTIACMYGYQAQRQQDGSWKQLSFAGKARPCRTG